MSMSVTVYLILSVGCLTDAFVMYDGPRKVSQILTVSNGGPWGTWHEPSFCADGSFAIGYDMKIEPYQGVWADDSGLNAIKLRCEMLDGSRYGGDISSEEGKLGNWKGLTRCNSNNGEPDVLTSFSLQVEEPQGSLSDDSAATYAKFHCRDFESTLAEYEIVKSPGHWDFGKYGSWSGSCAAHSAICGIRTRIEGTSSDFSSLNDVQLYCCNE